MKRLPQIIFISAAAIVAMLHGCSKGENTNAFNIYFYTNNPDLPPVYIVKGNKVVGKVPMIRNFAPTLDSSILHISTLESNTEITAADAKGHILESFTYTLDDNGAFKEGGGGYLLYNTTEKEKYNLMVRIDNQL